jgi:hypothetical protein
VIATLDLSYRELDARLRRAYRLLGLHPGADFDTYAAAALFDTTPDGAEQAVDQLLDAHLLQEPTPGRFRFHDLVRQHARARAAHEEPEADRGAALTRLLDYYRHIASAAMDVGYPYERARRPDVPPAETPSPVLRDETEATGWLDRELPNLLAVAAHAADHGWPDHIRQLSAVLHRHLRTRGRHPDAEVLHNRALTTARDVGDRRGEAEATRTRSTGQQQGRRGALPTPQQRPRRHRRDPVKITVRPLRKIEANARTQCRPDN